ncbi:hypothetical protein ACI798_12230 [Geodermatophilus sp. SYSU D01045]
MGRHAAADGAGTDPIVAAALATGTPATRHAPGATGQGTEGELGWPGDTTTGGGLGWPGSLDRADDAGEAAGTEVAGTEVVVTEAAVTGATEGPEATLRIDVVPAVPGTGPDGEPEPPGPRGWRRLFGGRAA